MFTRGLCEKPRSWCQTSGKHKLTSKPNTAFEGGSASPAPRGRRSAIALDGRFEGRGEISEQPSKRNVKSNLRALKSAFMFTVCKKVQLTAVATLPCFHELGPFRDGRASGGNGAKCEGRTRMSYRCSRHPVSECRRLLSTLWPLQRRRTAGAAHCFQQQMARF